MVFEDTAAKAVVRRFTDAGFNAANPAVIEEMMADDVIVYGLYGVDQPVRGIEAYLAWVRELFTAIPDAHAEIEALIAEESLVAVHWTLSGTLQDTFGALPATGEAISVRVVGVVRVGDGAIAEKWYTVDGRSLLQQLDVTDGWSSEALTETNRTMATSREQNKAVVRRFVDAWNTAAFEVIDEVVAADAVHHDPMDPPDLPRGPEGEKQLINAYHSAFPDATLDIEDMIAEGDHVAMRWTATGTHDGEFMGVDPTGTAVEISGFEINRVEAGQIVETWVLFDAFGLLQQLGALPDDLAN